MSTRGCVAVGDAMNWTGVYNHWDSYPTGLGVDVWAWVQAHGVDGLKDAISMYDEWDKIAKGEDPGLPGGLITSDDPDPLSIEWVYVADGAANAIHVLARSVLRRDPARPRPGGGAVPKRGWWDYGHCMARHRHVATLPLAEPEPNWAELESRAQVADWPTLTSEEEEEAARHTEGEAP